MLIRCESCDKLFDFDKFDGVCPACGHYHSHPPVITPTPSQESKGGVSGTARASSSDSAKTNRQRSRTLAVLVLWLLILVSGMVLRNIMMQRWRSSGMLGDVVTETVSADDVVLNRQHYTFGPYQKMSDRTAGLPDGYVLVRVYMDRKEADEWISGRDDSCCLQVETPSGYAYYSPLSSYHLERIYTDLCDDCMEIYDLQRTEADTGYMYFAVPADATSLSMYLEEATRLRYEDPRELTRILICPLEEAPLDSEDALSEEDLVNDALVEDPASEDSQSADSEVNTNV